MLCALAGAEQAQHTHVAQGDTGLSSSVMAESMTVLTGDWGRDTRMGEDNRLSPGMWLWTASTRAAAL